MKNKYGLSRHIPESVEREVRQRCKFSCVMCESGIYHFHHFEPTFADAKVHSPEGITLLCGQCHDYVERGLKSKSEVVDADKRRVQEMPSANILLSIRPPFYTIIGSAVFVGTGVFVALDDAPVFQVLQSTEGSSLEFSANLFDAEGNSRLIIERNVIRARPNNWDVLVQGPLIRIWSAAKKLFIEIKLHPPHGIHFRSVKMKLGNWIFDSDAKGRLTVLNSVTGGGILAAGAILSQGPLLLYEKTQTFGPSCFSTCYDSTRFNALAEAGNLEQLVKEISFGGSGGGKLNLHLTST
jgi:hypothetical protein